MIAVRDDTTTLIDELLAVQQRLTAVERFSVAHERQAIPAQEQYYRALLPTRAPSPGEQYAFAVDLDLCSGCKACVTACHNLNGLDEDETWRSVGLLIGGSGDDAFQQTVTTSCHHCIQPACLEGCPVLAYEKDPHTGIVRHLDDQCIGCQYCILKCPYDVPKYSSRRGIVRKCDMCSSRLAVNEAPACAQACPNQAIQITLVKVPEIVGEAREGLFLAGAPDPGYTQPTTRYHSKRSLTSGVASADAHALKLGHSHPALIFMLVLTQLSVGLFCVEGLLRGLFPANLMTQIAALQCSVALTVGLLALGTSTLHLGRPFAAWRAIIGLRTSWLSREIVAFGLFAVLALLNAGAFWLAPLRPFASSVMASAVALSGLLGVFCSLMIYHDTRRPFWTGASVALKFCGTMLILGCAAALFVTTLQGLLRPAITAHGAYQELTFLLAGSLTLSTALKLGFEACVLRHRGSDEGTPLRPTAQLLCGELAEINTGRFLLGIVGGVLLPLTFLLQRPAPGVASLGVTVGIFGFVLLGELLERYLFFTAAAPARMPGGIGA